MADFDAQQPVRAIATQFTTEVANAAGTTINPAEDYAQGSTTSGQNGVLGQGAVTTAAPAYSTGTTSPLSLTTVGALRIDGSATTQPVNVTQIAGASISTAAAGTQLVGIEGYAGGTLDSAQNTVAPANALVAGGVYNSAAPTLTSGNASQLQLDVNGQLKVVSTDTDALAQGSTTSGQLGNLSQAAVTTVAPTYVTATTNPLSMDLAGNLRVITSGGASSLPAIVTYFTDTAIATNASVTHTIAGPINLDEVHVTASGEVKGNIAYGVTGSETDHYILFTSASNQNANWSIKNTVVIAAGSSLKVTVTNRDKQAQDLYLSVTTH
ncbi:MAG: hypothetical protein ACREBR_05785 [bacterium]